MQRELGREIGDRLSRQMGQVARPPRVVGRLGLVEYRERSIVKREKPRMLRRHCQLRAWKDPEHAHRVVGSGPPDTVIEPPEYRPRLRMPAPPEIDGEFLEAADAIGKRRQSGIPVQVSVSSVVVLFGQAPTSDANL